MGYPWQNDDSDDDGNTGTGQQSGLPEPARKHLAKIEKENKELKAKLDELAKSQRSRTVEDTVKSKGFDPKVATFIPESVSDTAGVEKWLEDNGAMFAKAEQTPPTPEIVEDQSVMFPPEMMAQYAAITNATANSIPATKAQNLMAQIEAAKSPEELTNLLVANLPKGSILT